MVSLIPLEALKSGSPRHKEVMNIHLGAWPRCLLSSWQLRPVERASQLQAEETVPILCAGADKLSSLEPDRDRTLCACGGAWPRLMELF